MKEQDGRWTEGEIGGEGETDQEIGREMDRGRD